MILPHTPPLGQLTLTDGVTMCTARDEPDLMAALR